MSSIFNKIKNNYKNLGTILVFILAFLLIAYMMPRERKFTYDFQKGSPWKEEDLTAPFKFSIYKTLEEYQAEIDSILKDLKLYFTFDPYQFAEQLNKFKEGFQQEWIEYSLQKFNIPDEKTYLESGRYSSLRKLQDQYDDLIYKLFEKVYMKGIIEIPGESVSFDRSSYIVLMRGNIAEEKSASEFFTLKSAYEFVRSKLQEETISGQQRNVSRYEEFFNQFALDKYITPNIFYDSDASDREKSERLATVSRKKGMIQQGELIISEGEIVTQEKFQVLQSLKIAFNEQQGNVNKFLVLSGKLIFVLLSLVLIYVFLYNFRRELLHDLVKTSFILFMVILMIFVASTVAKLERVGFYIIPFTILPIILRTFFDERVAVFVHVLTTLIIGFIAPNSYEFIVLNILAGIVAIFSLTNLYRRSRFFVSALLVVVTYCMAYYGMSVVHEGSFTNVKLEYFANFGLNGVLILISFLLIFVFEKTFGFLSDTTLMELSDTNQPLLRKLAETAPGTFQHSLQVANLSEEAIYRIGGNPLLVRTGALYHDIGKMHDPIYFIENQTSGFNPHDNLEFEDSAKIIIGHVEKGLELARKNNLPNAIIDFIRTHHGTTTVQYFYKSYIKKYPEQEVDVNKFSYPGPKPFSKEMAVLMMADAVEAASRSIQEYSQETISNLVENIIAKQLKDKQFEDAPVTFLDIKTVKEVFMIKLKNIYHARIAYPK
ncbi:MAG: HDIG domain-containing protein [Bacteroidales bacterium]|jgi:putative nucleotidyltransferase with HDIG domain